MTLRDDDPDLAPDTAPVTAPVTALVPLRTGGKSRLGAALAPSDRAGLVLAMLDDVVAALHGAGVNDVLLLAGGEDAMAAARARGLAAVPDPDPTVGEDRTGDRLLRRAVDAGLAAVPIDHERLVVAGDLPLLSSTEVRRVLGVTADVVIVPTAGGGTALLRLAPGIELAARYGVGSAQGHATSARDAGHAVVVLDLPGARHDIDAAADLTALTALLAEGAGGQGRACAAFLSGVRG